MDDRRSADDLFSEAIDSMRKAYWAHVWELAESVIDEIKEAKGRGDIDARSGVEWLRENVHETCDGDSWVIYTQRAQAVLLVSDNDGAYVDSYGAEGMADRDGVNWSALAYAALEADLYEQLDAEGYDPNDADEWPCFAAE